MRKRIWKGIAMKSDEFIGLLRSYRWIGREIEDLNWDIEQKKYEMTGLAHHSIPMTKEQEASPLPMPKYHGGGKTMVERIDEVDELKEKKMALEHLRVSVDQVLGRMAPTDRALVVGYYVDGESADRLAEKHGYSERSPVYRKIKSAIKESL